MEREKQRILQGSGRLAAVRDHVIKSKRGGEELSWFVYMLRCGDGTLYTGITDDVERRLAVHRSGKGAKYTRGRGPLELVYQEEQPDKSAALRRELEIKRLRRTQKEELIEK